VEVVELGQVVVAGPVAKALADVRGKGGLTTAFTSLGIQADTVRGYLAALKEGRVVVAVQASDERLGRLHETMNRYRTVDVAPGAQQEGEIVLPVIEEQLQVGKREGQRGGVRIYSHVTERPVEETVRLREENVTVERHPVNRPVDPNDQGAFKEATFEMRQRAEVPVVAKEARVIEEVVIGKRVTERTETVRDTVKRTEVDVEQLSAHDKDRFRAFDQDFCQHASMFVKSGYTYDQVAPAYRFGSDLATNDSYRGKDWSKIEADAKKHWEEKNPGTWDRFKDAVQHGWQRVRASL
jgi:uncharacterized protein (TIGR02271 family)